MSSLFEQPKGDVSVVLPCSEASFSEFICGLLGKPQTINGVFMGAYDISKEDVSQLYHLLDQRVSQQNPSTCAQFSVEIIYNDGSSVLLDTLDTFIHYNEIRPVVTVGLVLSWTYLVKFMDKSAPEKQVITITIGGNNNPILWSPKRFETISFRIEHTARTWGADIEGLLNNQIKTMMKERHKLKDLIFRKSDAIGTVAGLIFFTMAIGGGLAATKAFANKQILAASQILKQAKEEQIHYLINYISMGAWPRFYYYLIFYLLLTIVASIFMGAWTGTLAETDEPSFVVLSKRDSENREKVTNNRDRKWRWFFASIILNIMIGIISNILFATYCKTWAP